MPFGLAVGREGELLDLGLRLLQEPVAVLLQNLAALVDRDALLELDVAALEPADDRLQFLERALEAHVLDVGVLGGVLAMAYPCCLPLLRSIRLGADVHQRLDVHATDFASAARL